MYPKLRIAGKALYVHALLVSSACHGFTDTFDVPAPGEPGGSTGISAGGTAAGPGSGGTAAGAAQVGGAGNGSGGTETGGSAGAAPEHRSEVAWSHSIGGPSNADRVYDVAVDGSGAAVFVGTLGDTQGTHVSFGFGCQPHDVADLRDAFVVKYAADGQCLWSRTFAAAEANSAVFATGVAATPEGDVIVTGFFEGGVAFGDTVLRTAGGYDIFLAKFARDTGNHIWSQRYGGKGSEWAWGIARDRASGIYVAGHYNGASDVGRGALPLFGDNDMLLAKFADADDASGGAAVWARGYGDSRTDSLTAVDINEFGELLVAGSVLGNVKFDDDNLVVKTDGSSDIFVASHSPEDGHAIWAKAYGAKGDDGAHSLAIMDSTVLVAAHFYGAFAFAGQTLTSNGASRDGALLEFELIDGREKWGGSFGGPREDAAFSVAKGAGGRVVVGGHFEETATFFGAELKSAGARDWFAVMLDNKRRLSWAERYGGKGADDDLLALAWDPTTSNSFLFGGRFVDTNDIENPALKSNGEQDIALGRLRP